MQLLIISFLRSLIPFPPKILLFFLVIGASSYFLIYDRPLDFRTFDPIQSSSCFGTIKEFPYTIR